LVVDLVVVFGFVDVDLAVVFGLVVLDFGFEAVFFKEALESVTTWRRSFSRSKRASVTVRIDVVFVFQTLFFEFPFFFFSCL
jgi:hypothetical protein